MDGDGFIAMQFGGDDCDDTNDLIFPGADETWYDTINQSCKVGSDFDQDGDGLLSHHVSGPDCNDEDPDIGSGETWWRDLTTTNLDNRSSPPRLVVVPLDTPPMP